MSSYMMNREDVIRFAEFIGAQTREDADELWFRKCPNCGASAGKDDEWKFSVNLKSGAFLCFRGSCGYKGHFVELAHDFNFPLSDGTEEKSFRELWQPKKIETRNEAVEYMKKRGISAEVTKRYEITVKKEQPNILVFPFYNITGKLEYIKYRDMLFNKNDEKHKQKEWAEKDAKPILFGMKQCKSFDRAILTEGQIDALSLAEAGLDNVLSVPMGCKNFAWLANCFEWLQQFQEIVVFGDREKGHITLIDEILSRFGSTNTVKCVKPEDYLFEKDANDILRYHGKQWLIQAVNNARTPQISAVKQLADQKIVDIETLESISTGMKDIDKTTCGLPLGTVTLLSGKCGDGKSTLMSQFVANALENGRKVFVYSGELMPFHFRRWLDSQLATARYVVRCTNQYGEIYGMIPPQIVERIGSWYRDRAFIYDNECATDNTSILETVEKAVKQYGVQLICIDNLMTAMDSVKSQNDLFLAQGNFVGELKKLAQRFNVAVVLIAHPRKSHGDFSNDDVSGSADITNKVDVVMSYSRDKFEKYKSNLEITKNRITGKVRRGEEKSR